MFTGSSAFSSAHTSTPLMDTGGSMTSPGRQLTLSTWNGDADRVPQADGCFGPTNDWGGVCFPQQTPMQGRMAPSVSFVGEGRGSYEKVQMYNYAGHGAVAPGQLATKPQHGKTCVLALGTAFGIVLLSVYCMLSRNESAPPGVPPAPAPQTHYIGPHAMNGCYSANASNVYDCNSRETDWSSEKKTWCCHCAKLGCSGDQMVAANIPPPQQPVACDTTGCHFFDGWHTCSERIQYHANALDRPGACQSAYQFVQTSCGNCSRCALNDALRRCEVPVPAAVPTVQPPVLAPPQKKGLGVALFDCQDHSARQWSVSKKLWCCTYKRIGCLSNATRTAGTPEATTTVNTGSSEEGEVAAAAAMRMLACSRTCVYEGLSASCRHRIVYAAKNQFRTVANACILAEEQVLQQCPSCSACALADTGCETEVGAPGAARSVVPASLTTATPSTMKNQEEKGTAL